MYVTWGQVQISSTQQDTILALFNFRDMLGALTSHRFTTRDEARGALFEAIALIEALNPEALQAETGWWLYPRDDKTWGISLPIIGKGFEKIGGVPGSIASVHPMTPSMRPVQSAISQAWEFIHTHPSRNGSPEDMAGFSVEDVASFLATSQTGEALSVHDNGAQYRLTLVPSAQSWPMPDRLEAATMLTDLYEQTINIWNAYILNPDPSLLFQLEAQIVMLNTYLSHLPLQFERFSETQSNSSPINGGGLPLGPTDEATPQTPLSPIPPALEKHFQELRQRLAP